MLDGSGFQNMCGSPELAENAVHIWQIHLVAKEDRINWYRKLLSVDEIQRSDHFYRERDKARFVVARSAMRMILAEYLHVPPQELAFSYTAKGKPEFVSDFNESGIKFNLSHSRDFAFLAVTQGLCVGVDIEFINHEFAADDVAARFFSPNEISALRALSPGERAGAFFECWTRKEAYIKATGEGLSLPLDSFDVAFGPGVPPALLRVEVFPQELSRWSMYNLSVPQGYAAALVVEGKQHQLRQARWYGDSTMST
ncbi:MAG TPA: 4'-phosphopantetheinyl transferase superfamily protein [Candidatus Angelobacter sp.]|nr:4'-phosphopantetheinyl transferase superfamily protein [Candidatus Angelobacter sp.]